MEAVIYEREKLYEEVWKESVSNVAKRYGISDNALRKHCKKLNIPLPPRGYWAQLKAGIQVMQTPLPEEKERERMLTA